MTGSVLKQDPNTKRFKRTLIYFNTDTQYVSVDVKEHLQKLKALSMHFLADLSKAGEYLCLRSLRFFLGRKQRAIHVNIFGDLPQKHISHFVFIPATGVRRVHQPGQ